MMDGFYSGGMRLLLFIILGAMYFLGSYLFFSQGLSTARLIIVAMFSLAYAALYSIQLLVLMKYLNFWGPRLKAYREDTEYKFKLVQSRNRT